MSAKSFLTEQDLAALAKQYRLKAGKSRAEASRELNVSATSIHNAEETPQLSLLKMRIRIVEQYSPYRVKGPVYLLENKKG